MNSKSGIYMLLIVLLTSCSENADTSENSKTKDSVAHGYNELADQKKRETYSVSDYNSDNEKIENISRPAATVIKTDLDTALLFGIWTTNPDGPHADFEITNKSFFVVDYDGDGDMPYELIDNKLEIYYNDFIQEGQIISVTKDKLIIRWESNEDSTTFVRWEQ